MKIWKQLSPRCSLIYSSEPTPLGRNYYHQPHHLPQPPPPPLQPSTPFHNNGSLPGEQTIIRLRLHYDLISQHHQQHQQPSLTPGSHKVTEMNKVGEMRKIRVHECWLVVDTTIYRMGWRWECGSRKGASLLSLANNKSRRDRKDNPATGLKLTQLCDYILRPPTNKHKIAASLSLSSCQTTTTSMRETRRDAEEERERD